MSPVRSQYLLRLAAQLVALPLQLLEGRLRFEQQLPSLLQLCVLSSPTGPATVLCSALTMPKTHHRTSQLHICSC